MHKGSVRVVRDGLRLLTAATARDDVDGTLASHVAELERRVRRLNQRGGALAQVRLSSDLLTWRTASEATA